MLKVFSVMVLVLIFSVTGLVLANDHHEQAPEQTGFQAEFIGQVQFVQGRITQLEQAFPEDKFSWRPDEGVRSVSEVFMHTAFANYLFIRTSGQAVPDDIKADVKPQEWESTATGKEEIKQILDRSFADLISALKNLSEEDLEKNVHVFDMDMSLRNFMLSMLSHMHEHLGQAIAYARSNGITPPWTAERQKAAEKQ